MLLSVDGIFDELVGKVDERPDLAARIARPNVEALIEELRLLGAPVERLPEPYAEVGRDRDDYVLIAHAVFAEADGLGSWDKNLRDLGHIEGLTIGTPPELLATLREVGNLPPHRGSTLGSRLFECPRSVA